MIDARARRLLQASAMLLLLAATSVGTVAQAQPAGPGSGDGFSETRTVTRTFTSADGSTYAFPSHRVTVGADRTHDLHGRERVRISWSGAQPSGGRAANPYGENGLQQEYPVVILQCRGSADPAAPAAEQVRPETCWTGSVAQRSQVTRSAGDAVWSRDADADPSTRGRLSGMTPFPDADTCPTADIAPYSTHLTPFVAAKGTTYPACDASHMPPEAAVGAAFPPAELAAFTDPDGSGSVQFEVRSSLENESLGCSHTVDCAIVVIPIAGLSCERPATPMTLADQACRKGGRFAPGSSNFTNDGVDLAVSPSLWWSPSNWKNRFTIPITFGLPPDTCDILDQREPTGFYGSELLAQAALQWSPAYCLRKDRFKFQLNQMSDAAGWNLMESGEGVAAEVSSEHERRGEDPVGYAPTAVTGFSIGYVVDRPGNRGELDRLRLTPRLVAKLLTQSYLGSDLGRGHPGMSDNPLAIVTDPEFTRLNPGLSTNPQEASASLLSLSDSSDVVEQLTDYIAHDADAMAFIHGKPDPWGMVVNPSYRDVAMPTAEWPLLDTYVPETENNCRQKNPAVYFNQLAAPVTTMRKISEALLDAWPNVQTRCDVDQATQLFKLGRIDRQAYGSRFMLGVVSLGDAARYGLRSAALETRSGSFVAPDRDSLSAAVDLARQPGRFEPFSIDQADVKASSSAYPGAMVVYTAARLRNLDPADATKVAQFIRVSVSEGQRAGSGNGELPDGFLPIADHGVTRPLFASAQQVADAVEAQHGDPTGGDTTSPGAAGGAPVDGAGFGGAGGAGGLGGLGGAGLPVTAPGDSAPLAAAPGKSGAPVAPVATAVRMPSTQPVGSRLAGGLLPALLLVGGLGLGASGVLRIAASQRGGRR